MPREATYLRAQLRPSTADDKARTVELIASTGADVVRFDAQGRFIERLEITTAAIDLSRLDGMPLLDSHRQDGLERVLGVVRSARVEAAQLIVTVEFSERAEAIWQDVRSGIISNVSVGYEVKAWSDGSPVSGVRKRTATKWTPVEVSIVPVGADPKAKSRGATLPEIEVVEPAPVTRKAINTQIRAMAATMSLGSDFTDPLIDDEATLEQAQAAAIARVAQTRSAAPVARATIITSNEDPALLAGRVGEALYATRSNSRHQLSDEARQYANMTCLDIARHCLSVRGVSTTGLSPAETFTRAGQITTGDFSAIFADTANRTLRDGYATVPSTLKAVAKQTTAKDFRAKTSVQFADTVTLEKVNENGEYKHGGFVEAKESYKIDTFGKILAVSRKALINDDLGAFTDMAGKMGQAAAEFEAQFLVDLLVSNAGLGPTMDDGKTFFHADHKNLGLAIPGAIEVATVSAGRLAMRNQKGINGRLVSPAPKYMLVPSSLETDAEIFLATINAAKTADVNPFAGKLELLVEPRLTGINWYLVADPASVPGLEFAYLQGEEGPQTFTRDGFDVDGVEVKVRLDFGAGFTDWRAWQQADGTS